MQKEIRLALKRERPIKDSFDGPWKVYFRESLEDFLRFVDAEAHTQIDWNLTPVFLDKELDLLSRKIKRSPVIVDSLVKVWLKTEGEVDPHSRRIPDAERNRLPGANFHLQRPRLRPI